LSSGIKSAASFLSAEPNGITESRRGTWRIELSRIRSKTLTGADKAD